MEKQLTILKIHQVIEVCSISKSLIYAMMKVGKFPKNVKLFRRGSGWISQEVQAWIEDRAKKRSAITQ